MKQTKKILAAFLIFAFAFSNICVSKDALAKSKIVKDSDIKGKHVGLSSIKSIKLNGSKVTIKACFGTSTKSKKKTFRIVNKPHFYHAEDSWYDNGTVTKKKFVKLVKESIQNGFPGIHIWIKNNKIVCVGESA